MSTLKLTSLSPPTRCRRPNESHDCFPSTRDIPGKVTSGPKRVGQRARPVECSQPWNKKEPSFVDRSEDARRYFYPVTFPRVSSEPNAAFFSVVTRSHPIASTSVSSGVHSVDESPWGTRGSVLPGSLPGGTACCSQNSSIAVARWTRLSKLSGLIRYAAAPAS